MRDYNKKVLAVVEIEEALGWSWVAIICDKENLRLCTKPFRDPRIAMNLWLNIENQPPIRALKAKYGEDLIIQKRIPSIGVPSEGGF